MTDSVKKIQKKLRLEKLDAILISSPANIRYLTGYEARDSYLLVSPKKCVFITDFRYLLEAQKNIKDIQIQLINGSLFKTIAKTAKALDIKCLGFETRNLIHAEYHKIKEELGRSILFLPTIDFVEDMRKIKSAQELGRIKKATCIAIKAMQLARKIAKPGMREIDLAFEIERFIRLDYGAKLSFDIIVASGPNSSFPHHITSKRKLKENEALLIDLGVDLEGYKSDLTRVFFLGKIPAYARRIYDIVLAAQCAAIKGIKAAIPIIDIDIKGRLFITK